MQATTGEIRKNVLSAAILVILLFLFGTPARANTALKPSTVNFGNQKVGTTSAPVTVTLTNSNKRDFTIASVSLSGAQFSFSGPSMPVTLASGQILTVYVTFTPAVAQICSGTLVFTRANGATITDSLSGTGISTQPQPPAITNQPSNQSVMAGQSATFSVAASGSAPLGYQWKKNGIAITGASSATYTLPSATTSDSNSQFSVTVANPVGNANSNTAMLTVIAPVVAPSITMQPTSQSITAGQTATFSVAASGTSPMTYQWMKNSSPISGATSSTYTTPAESTADNNATFAVTAANSAGTATSATATLVVNPVSTGCVTTSGSWANSPLALTATGSFRVSFDATPTASPMDGAMGLSFGPATGYTSLAAIVRFNSAGMIDAMNSTAYAAAAAIPFSAGTSYHFILDVNTVAHTYSAYVMIGSVQTTIGSNFAFRAEQSTTSSLNNLGTVSIIASDTVCNIALPTGAGSPVAPAITTQPSSKTITAGQTATFSVTAAGTAPMTYQWMKNSIAITGATSASYTTPAETTADNNAQFTVTVTNGAGNATSSAAILTVNAAAVAPAITTQPSSQTVNSGQTATFDIAATGTSPMTYQWKKNSTTITGATSSTYTTPATTSSDNGAQFTVVLSNSAGSATSAAATLTVNAVAVAPSITSQPVSKTVVAGQTASFSVAASGTSPMTFQWMKNSVAISGATSSSYTTPAETTADNNALFSVTVTNSMGNATSNSATLTVSATTLVLNSSASALIFGSVNIPSSSTKNVILTNAGNSIITISSVTVNGAGFNASGVPTGLNLNPGQTATLAVSFSPSSAVSVTGTAYVASNASNSPDSITLSGTGVTVVNHSASLSWSPSTSTVMGYNTYSATTSGGPYTKLTSAPNAATSYTDSTVQAGLTYYYVVTSVDTTGMESAFLTEVSALIP